MTDDTENTIRPPSAPRPYQYDACVLLVIIVPVVLIFAQSLRYSYCEMDDGLYVFRNAKVQAGLHPSGLGWALLPQIGHWHPLTWYSLMADVTLFGNNPAGHRFVNIALHAANAILLYWFLRLTTAAILPSAAVAVMFAVHPLHVEPVVWISSRKDVLSTFFLLSLFVAYTHYSRAKTFRRYLLVFFLLLLGLAAKTMLVSAPLLMLIADWWPLRRVDSNRLATARTLIKEKIPFFCLSLFAGAMAYFAAQQGNVLGSEEQFPLGARFANAIRAYGLYLWKTLWPVDLAVYYPHPGAGYSTVSLLLFATLLLFLSAIAVLLANRAPYLFAGWFWYGVTLVPVIGLLQIGGHAMADRYAYVPITGLFIIAVFAAAHAAQRSVLLRKIAVVLLVGTVLALGTLSWNQVRYWRDGVTLFSHALRVTRDNAPVRNNLGYALLRAGRADEALVHFDAALRLQPNHLGSLVNKAIALGSLNRVGEAEECLHTALAIEPNHAAAKFNLGVARFAQGDFESAAENFEAVVLANPDDVAARVALAETYIRSGQTQRAIDHVNAALRLDPNHATARELLQTLGKS